VQIKYLKKALIKIFLACTLTITLSADDNNMSSKEDKEEGKYAQQSILVILSQYTTSSSWPTSQVQLGKLLMQSTLESFLG